MAFVSKEDLNWNEKKMSHEKYIFRIIAEDLCKNISFKQSKLASQFENEFKNVYLFLNLFG